MVLHSNANYALCQLYWRDQWERDMTRPDISAHNPTYKSHTAKHTYIFYTDLVALSDTATLLFKYKVHFNINGVSNMQLQW